MKSVIKGIVLVLVALVVIIVGGAYLIPSVVVVERATVIAVPPDKVYAIAGNMKRFNEWSPWAERDPAATYVFEGPEEGVGQKMSWKSAKPDVGSGSQTIIEAIPNEKIVSDIDFGQMGKSTSTMTLVPVNDGTAVVWRFTANVDGVMERWMSLMFDKWIGADYVKGLAKLKILAETLAQGG